MVFCRDCPYDSASCWEAKSHEQSLQEAISQAQQSWQEAKDRGQSQRKPNMTDRLCRKRKLADLFIPSDIPVGFLCSMGKFICVHDQQLA